jgi:hypothetical protein
MMDFFIEALKKATSRIDEMYFQLPVVGKENPIFRERVYCYELYHQMRLSLGDVYPYKLCGEIDKYGHPLFRNQEGVINKKPDFLLHKPGMEENLVVMEVKPANGEMSGIQKDIETLDAFINIAGYRHGILLIYGKIEKGKLQQVIEKIRENGNPRISFWNHGKLGEKSDEIRSTQDF